MFHKNRITRSLCAVMLCAGLLLSSVLSVSAEAAPGDVKSSDELDIYAIDIEFGNLSFYYDYGVWDVNDMRYEAAATSAKPANGTISGYPGWYGFDDISNKITITNQKIPGSNDSGAVSPVTVVLEYRSLTDDELAAAGADAIVSRVSMTVSGTPAESESAVSSSQTIVWNNNTVDVPVGEVAVGYIHLAGEPTLPNGEVYESATMQPIGMLTLRIQSPM